jgi:hypothetical protein
LLNPQGDFSDKGLGTNPTGSAEWCAGSAYHSGMPSDTGMPRAKRKRAKTEVNRHRTAGHRPAVDVTDPSGLAESLLLRVGGWDSEFQRENCWGQS